MLTDDMGKITKNYETNSGHILSAALTVVICMYVCKLTYVLDQFIN